MKINVWGINYSPELTGIAVYNSGLCEHLAKQGHDVTMVTGFPYYPQWKLDPIYRARLFAGEASKGVNIKRCWLYVPERLSTATRILHEASFVITSSLRQLFLPPPDLYIVISPPLLLGLAAYIICLLNKSRYIFHVQDLQPDAAVGLNMIKQGFFTKLLYWFEKIAYEKAIAVSAISEQMIEAIEKKGISSEKLILLPNWVETDKSIKEAATFNAEKNSYLVSYAGNLGVKQGLDIVIETARKLACDGINNINFVIAGNGADESRLKALWQEAKLDNLKFMDVLPEQEHNALLQNSDICLITQKSGAASSFLPSKLLKILSLGKPVLASAEAGTPLASAIANGGFGKCIPPEDSAAFAQCLVSMLADANIRKQMSEAGKRYVAQFDSQLVLSNFEGQLKALTRAES
jgi:colanic acid biosynthesis glycosyl transferase WcaI